MNIIISHSYTSWLPFQQIAAVSYNTGQCQSLWLSGRALAVSIEIHIIHIITGQPPIPDSSRTMHTILLSLFKYNIPLDMVL